MRDLFYPGRSVIHATNGMAATSHPLSTATAVNILNDGGNAIDAAIAAVAAEEMQSLSTSTGGTRAAEAAGAKHEESDQVIR